MEIKECYLDYFIKHLPTVEGRPFKKPFRAISSSLNAICLFTADVDVELCKTIAGFFAEEVSFLSDMDESHCSSDMGDSKQSTMTTPTDEVLPNEFSNHLNTTLNSLLVPKSNQSDAGSFQSIHFTTQAC